MTHCKFQQSYCMTHCQIQKLVEGGTVSFRISGRCGVSFRSWSQGALLVLEFSHVDLEVLSQEALIVQKSCRMAHCQFQMLGSTQIEFQKSRLITHCQFYMSGCMLVSKSGRLVYNFTTLDGLKVEKINSIKSNSKVSLSY